jgi:hypothetical protein
VRIQGVVDLDGRFLEPVVLGEGPPATIYRVLEALREWRYAPARRALHLVASFRSVFVGALPAPATPLRLGQHPPPGPGREAVIYRGVRGPVPQRGPNPPPP